jgi:peptide-methionine (S)-S-oxide reductase
MLEIFWNIHDPTTSNRQGPDIGTQYRSAIFYHDKKQKEIALSCLQKLQESGKFNTIVTEIEPASEFYPAEDYHQQYLEKTGICRSGKCGWK